MTAPAHSKYLEWQPGTSWAELQTKLCGRSNSALLWLITDTNMEPVGSYYLKLRANCWRIEVG